MNSNDANTSPAYSGPVIVEKELSHAIVGSFFEVYSELGYGFVESLYARALEIAMRQRGLRVDREYPIAVTFRGQQIGFHRIDMLVEQRVIVELKSTERLAESAGDSSAATSRPSASTSTFSFTSVPCPNSIANSDDAALKAVLIRVIRPNSSDSAVPIMAAAHRSVPARAAAPTDG